MEHLKPVASGKTMSVNCTTPAKQNHILPLLFSTHVEDGRGLDADDSMLGQPPSVCAASPLSTDARRERMVKSERDPDSEDFEVNTEKGFDIALRQVFREVQDKTIEACVLEERLDEKDIELMSGEFSLSFFWLALSVCACTLFSSPPSLFPQISGILTSASLTVPHLPQPTVHSSVSFQPTNMGALICRIKGNVSTNASLPQHITLQSVKGIKPLNLELSWRYVLYS